MTLAAPVVCTVIVSSPPSPGVAFRGDAVQLPCVTGTAGAGTGVACGITGGVGAGATTVVAGVGEAGAASEEVAAGALAEVVGGGPAAASPGPHPVTTAHTPAINKTVDLVGIMTINRPAQAGYYLFNRIAGALATPGLERVQRIVVGRVKFSKSDLDRQPGSSDPDRQAWASTSTISATPGTSSPPRRVRGPES